MELIETVGHRRHKIDNFGIANLDFLRIPGRSFNIVQPSLAVRSGLGPELNVGRLNHRHASKRRPCANQESRIGRIPGLKRRSSDAARKSPRCVAASKSPRYSTAPCGLSLSVSCSCRTAPDRVHVRCAVNSNPPRPSATNPKVTPISPRLNTAQACLEKTVNQVPAAI